MSCGAAYELVRSRRKTMALEVTADCRVVVRAPMQVSAKQVEAFVSAHGDWVAKHLARQRERREARPEPGAEEREALIRRAKEVLPDLVAQYSARMGLYPAGVRITGAKSRFGSCSGKNRICFSWRLMQYPQPAIEYVVVHELAHIRHKNHGEGFYGCVAQVLPDWRERRQLLR